MRLIKLVVANARGMKMAVNIEHIVALAAIEDPGGHITLNSVGVITTTGNYIVNGSVDSLTEAINTVARCNPTLKDN